jgi:hypothetical protein
VYGKYFKHVKGIDEYQPRAMTFEADLINEQSGKTEIEELKVGIRHDFGIKFPGDIMRSQCFSRKAQNPPKM